MSSCVNTTDASLGNPISTEQIRNLPIEAQNVVQLLSLQPGAVFIPVTNPVDRRPALRRGGRRACRPAERHARRRRRQRCAEPDRVHLGGPHDPGGAAGIPRQHLQLQRRQRPLERPAGVAGHAQRHEPVRWIGLLDVPAHGHVEQRVFPEALAAAGSDKESEAPKLDKDIYGGSFGGPIRRNRLFFFGNLERLKEQSESRGRAQRAVELVPRRRADVSVRVPRRRARAAACAGSAASHTVPGGWYGMTPAEIAAHRSAGHRTEPGGASQYFSQYPCAERAGLDGPTTSIASASRRRSRTCSTPSSAASTTT